MMTKDRKQQEFEQDSDIRGQSSNKGSNLKSHRSKKRPLWRRMIKWTLWTVTSIILLIGLIWLGLQTPWAKKKISAWVQRFTAETGDYQVKLEGLGGTLPFSITLKQASISNEKGPWVELENFDFSLDAKALLNGTIHIKWLKMDRISLSRLPPPGAPEIEQKMPSENRGLPSLPSIVVDDIRFKQIVLGPQVAGKPMRFSLFSQVQTAQTHVQTHAILTDLERKDDAFKLAADYDLKSEHLKAHMTYHEAKGGLAATLLKLKDLSGIELKAQVDGSLSHLKGTLDLRMGGYGNAAFHYDVGIEKAIRLALQAELAAEKSMIPKQLSQLLADQTVHLDLQASLKEEKNLYLQKLAIKNGPLVVALEGNADLKKETISVTARIEGADLSPVLKETGIALHGLKPVLITARGPFMAPDVSVSTAFSDLSAQGASLKETGLDIHALFKKGYSGLEETSLTLSSKKTDYAALPKISGPLKIVLQAKSPDFTSWHVNQLDMGLPGIKTVLKNAAIDVSKMQFSGDLKMDVNSVAVLLPSNGLPLNGALSIKAHADGKGAEAIKTETHIRLSKLTGLPPQAADIIGSEVNLQARADMKQNRVNLSGINLKADQISLSSEGWFDLAKQSFDVSYNMTLDLPENAASTLNHLPIGVIKSQGKAFGKLNRFRADVNLSSAKLQMQDSIISDIKARLTAKGLPQEPEGSVDLKGLLLAQVLDLESNFKWNGSRLSIRKARVRLPGIDLSAQVDLAPASSDFSGKIGGKIASLAILKSLTGVDVKGSGTFQVNAPITGSEKEVMTLHAEFNDLQYEGTSVSKLNFKARSNDLKVLQGKFQVNALKICAGTTQIENFALNAAGNLKNARVDFKSHGTSKTAVEAPFSLEGRLSLSHEDLLRIRLDELKGLYENVHMVLSQPATVTLGIEQAMLDKLELRTDKGKLQVTGGMKKDTVQATARISDLPLSLLEPFLGQDLTGSAAVEMDLSGPMKDPGVNVAVHIKEYQVMGQNLKKPILVNLKLHTRREGDRILADLELSGIGNTPFTASGSIPAHLCLKPFAFEMNKTGPLKGKLQGKLDLMVLDILPAMANQQLRGLIEMDLGAEGTLEKWGLNGGLSLTNGRYENVEQGILLDRIEARMDAKEQTLILSKLNAADGDQGNISLTGKVDVTPPFSMAFALAMNRATLLRKETLSVTAGGNLDVKGNKERVDLTGEIDLDRTEITIPKRFPPGITVIPVKVINDPSDKTAKATESGGPPAMIQLNLGVNIPERFFVRGRGLDAEFKGRLTVQGPAHNPVVRGSLNVVRGTFLCLSRTFKIVNGQIAFDGSTPPVPFLNIDTEVNAGEITAKVDVSGPADDFKLVLSSQPPLPQDEIMAQILFGQSVAKLNTFQALQLAYSVNELAGGYGPDIIGKTRGFLGLDRLSFSGGDEGKNGKNSSGEENSNGPSVTLGKYVSDRVYVGVEQDLTDAKQDVIVDVNITPNFTVESKAGTKSGAGLGFNWNYDY
jgi:translocation and assembly module TamB